MTAPFTPRTSETPASRGDPVQVRGYGRQPPPVWPGDFLPGVTVSHYLRRLEAEHPLLVPLIDLRPSVWATAARWLATPTEFDDDDGGRGDSYRLAQWERDARSTGIMRLLKLAGCRRGQPRTVLDVFGGDGLVADVWRRHGGHTQTTLITADVSGRMVLAALDAGLPALRQPAQRMLLADGCVDAALLAYGTHHLRHEQDRACAFSEAFRVVRSGGRIVVHDFAIGSAMARWFCDVVDRYTAAGHPYEHFTPDGLDVGLRAAGFADVAVDTMYDPFRIHATDACAARHGLVTHIARMYGLTEITAARGEAWLEGHLRSCFRIEVTPSPPARNLATRRARTGWVAELPRFALVATGRKP